MELGESSSWKEKPNHEQTLTKARGHLSELRKYGHGYKYRTRIILAKIYL